MTILTLVQLDPTGVEVPVVNADPAGDYMPNPNGESIFYVRNTAVEAITVRVYQYPNDLCSHGVAHPVNVVVQPGTDRFISSVPANRFNNPDGNVRIGYTFGSWSPGELVVAAMTL